MNFLTLGIHFPRPEDLEKFVSATQSIADKARTLDGLIDTGAWTDTETGGVVLVSLWASREQVDAARLVLGGLAIGQRP